MSVSMSTHQSRLAVAAPFAEGSCQPVRVNTQSFSAPCVRILLHPMKLLIDPGDVQRPHFVTVDRVIPRA